MPFTIVRTEEDVGYLLMRLGQR